MSFSTTQVAAMMLNYNHFATHVCGFVPDPWQYDILLNPSRPTIVCSSRQVGKTHTTATLVAAHSVLVANQQSLIVSTGHAHAGYVLARVKECLRQAEAAGLCKIEGDSASRVQLCNGSIVFVAGSNPKASRGYSVSGLLVCDEAAHLPDEEAGETGVIDSVLPTLSAAGGTPLMLSTPNGRQNRFARIFEAEDDYWHRITVPWQQCPRLHGHIIRAIKATMPSAIFEQEYNCNFLSGGAQLFDWDDLQASLTSTPAPVRYDAVGGDDEADEDEFVAPMFDPSLLKEALR